MAPSTATPSNMHRAPVACLKCRAAKVRCLVSRREDRCDRCIANNAECFFAQPRRAKRINRTHKEKRNITRWATRNIPAHDHDNNNPPPRDHNQESITVFHNTPGAWPSPSTTEDASSGTRPMSAYGGDQIGKTHQDGRINSHEKITGEVRAKIIATLASLRGKRGAPFSFVTSGERQPFTSNTLAGQNPTSEPQGQQSNPDSLKLSWLLRPVRPNTTGDQSSTEISSVVSSPAWVPMPSYTSSMTLGQIAVDPVHGGILSQSASEAMFHHFMVHMNAQWEYILDPRVDTHDEVRRRSSLLFSTVLFCASKFSNYQDGHIVTMPDPFLQTRLCNVARNLTIRTMAEGDRSIETMQALYLLVCWKDPDDDISYLHSGYAFRVLNDLDLEADIDPKGDKRTIQQAVRRRRIWLALYRQDKQQSLFFIRRASPSLGRPQGPALHGDLFAWTQLPSATPLDLIASCSADIRRIQSRLRDMIQPSSSSTMLPCILDLMSSELVQWRSAWKTRLSDLPVDSQLQHPGIPHIQTLMGLWEHGARLHVGSAILRQALMTSVTSSIRSHTDRQADLPDISEVLPPDVTGLTASIDGAFGILRHLIAFPKDHVRHAPDAVILLASNAALFLCLLLCLPCNGILGPAFQKTAIRLIQDVARHIRLAVQSPQDTLTLHAAYLESLVQLILPSTTQTYIHDTSGRVPMSGLLQTNSTEDLIDPRFDETTLEAAYVLAGGMNGVNNAMDDDEIVFDLPSEFEQNLDMQGLANLLDMSSYWEMPPVTLEGIGKS